MSKLSLSEWCPGSSEEDTPTSPYNRVLRAKRKQTQSNKINGGGLKSCFRSREQDSPSQERLQVFEARNGLKAHLLPE